MGSCFSSDSDDSNITATFSTPTAKVISIKGYLHEYPIPITAAQVLQSETDISSSSSSSFFICNSDKLYFDDFIPPLDSTELLQPNQIYFILPIARLHYPLAKSDMAALAVKASTALLDCSKKTSRRRRIRTNKILVCPLVDHVNPSDHGDGDLDEAFEGFHKATSSGTGLMSRSGSVRKLQRNASRRAERVCRSFTMRLSTIYENEASVAAQPQRAVDY